MRLNLQLLLLLCIIAVTTHAQNDQPPSINIGDPAPPLRVQWLKGEPVPQFEKGQVYVVEFWATWCKPCIAAMPHLSALANQYKDKVTMIGIDVYESKNMEKVKAFVDSVGQRMDYHVAAEDSNFMESDWLAAIADMGIPRSFVVNAEGRIAWIGHPKLGLAEVLPKIINNAWDINEALAKRDFEKHIEALDDSAQWELVKYQGYPLNPLDFGKPDSALLLINEMVRKEPKLKYAPSISANTFIALLKTDPHKAYAYGKAMLASSEDPYHHIIFLNIREYSNKINLPPEIYLLGIEAYQGRMHNWAESANFPSIYYQMADWYWRANHKSKAIATEQKAIEALKAEKNFSTAKMAAFELRLQQYRTISQQQRFPLIDKLQ